MQNPEIVREGFEQKQQYCEFREPAECAAQISALSPDLGSIDPNLAEVIEAWPALSEAKRAGILATVRF